MKTRYQVFISSTFVDLETERNEIMRALMKMNHIPAGMELFPAADEDQMQFIRRIIDDCDYYILLIGGRYGSTSSEGVSYTEMEYDYAKSRGLKIIALLHEDPDLIVAGKTERSSEAAEKLQLFREKVSNGRMINYWSTSKELPGIVAISLMEAITTYPAVGWVRGDSVASEDLLRQINDLRLENEALRSTGTLAAPEIPVVPNLASLDETITIGGKYSTYHDDDLSWTHIFKWSEIFWHISPYLDQNPTDNTLQGSFTQSIKAAAYEDTMSFYISDQSFQTVLLQIRALKLAMTSPVRTSLAVDGSW
jgi:hypothetical protein